ncbi:MAG: hypothetical protein H8E46_09450 [FCB group bacterium]|nr:hypothetical protein [FCB group bacterium]
MAEKHLQIGSKTGEVTARKCDCCGHHEIGITTDDGEYIPLKPGMIVQIISVRDSG